MNIGKIKKISNFSFFDFKYLTVTDKKIFFLLNFSWTYLAFCSMDLAYAVREASLFRITGPNVEKAKKLLDKFVEERMDPETKRMLETGK